MKNTAGWMGSCALLGRTLSVLLLFITFSTPLPVLAVPPPAGVAIMTAPEGGFGIDGDLLSGISLPAVGDWMPGPAGSSVLNSAGQPNNPSFTFHFVDPFGNMPAELIFAGGLKWTDNPNTWGWTSGKPSSKTDINNVLLHISEDTNGHIWAVMSADRSSTSGDSYIDFELLQNTLSKTNGGAFVSAGPHGGRTVNDLLLSLAFTGGGKVADFFAWRWLPDGMGGYAYVDATASLPIGKVFVALNSNTIAAPYSAFGASSYSANAFAEAAIDLTALLGNFDPCLSFGFKTIMVKTKASSSSSASIEDFIDPIQYSLRIGPAAGAGPDQALCTQGASTTFALSGKAHAGLAAVASTTWSVAEGQATIESSGTLNTSVHVTSGRAVLRLSVLQANGCTATDEITLTVKPLPLCGISGPAIVCPGATQQFQANPGQQGYSWSLSGPGAIVGPANGPTVSIVAGPACGETLFVSLTTSSNGCSSSCSFEALIQDTNPPTLTIPSNIVLDCPGDTRTNVTGVATASDDCGSVKVTFSDSVTNLCAGTKLVERTWMASDACGNITVAVQTIAVQDVTRPTLIRPPDQILECPSGTGTDVAGVATASDLCGAVQIAHSDVTTNGCGGTKVVFRTWTATDECGHITSALQTITLRDTTSPNLRIPPDATFECPSDGGTNIAGIAISDDACGSVSVSFQDLASTNCGGARIIARTWEAIDQCGNATNAVQKITIRDTQPPLLSCPPSLVLECPADTRTNFTGVATAQDLCGTVSISYKDTATNDCGFAEGIVRTWTAVDQCGNSVSATQSIMVRDTTPPSLLAPPNLTLECPGVASTNATGVATATDNCGAVTVTFADSITNLCGNTQVIARKWSAADQCGNVTSAVQTITVRDTTPPSLVIPQDLALECPSDGGTNVAGIAMAEDLCGSVLLRYMDSVQAGCGGTKVISRSWIATDACGNTTNRIQKVTVKDTRPPALSMPSDRIVECGNSTEPAATGNATATDLCGTVTVRFSDHTTNGCGGSKTIARTWTATDECGNSTNAVQRIVVRDTTPPSLALPASVVMECPGDTRTNVTGVALSQDACSSPSVTYSDTVTNGCGATRTVLRLWTATDACGNTTNGVQTIAVVDTLKPTLTCPPITVQCPGDVPTPYSNLAGLLAAGGKATDRCDATLAFSLLSDSGLVGSCPGTVTRVYRVVDDCGNYSDAIQTITVRDTVKPIVTCPPAITIECGDDPLDLARTGQATATDNCDTNVAVTWTDALVDSSYSIKWYASDPNSGNAPYLPTYIKVAPGSLPCPEGAVLSGRAADPLRNAVAYGPTTNHLDALTSLGGEPMHFGQVVPFQVVIGLEGGPGPENGTIEFLGSWSTHTTSNDELGYDKNYMVYCAFVDVADQGTFDPHQNARVESYRSELYGEGTINEQIRGTFRVSGLDVGDRVVVEIWVVLKNSAPRNFGGTISSELVAAWKPLNPPVPLTTGNQTVSIGNLSKIKPLPAPQEQPPLGPLPPQPPPPAGRLASVIGRTWTATDDCGNTSSCMQSIAVRDSMAPVLVAPADLVLELPADTSTNNTGIASSSDRCGAVTISYKDSVVTNCGITHVITRSWTATDGWNVTTRTQLISVVDTTPPVFTSAAAQKTAATSGEWQFDEPRAVDACGIPIVRVVSTVTNEYDGTLSITRVWEAADPCGNKATTEQTIEVVSMPAIVSAPGSLSIESGRSGVLSVSASGSGPLSYQWQLNGVNIPGANTSSLNLPNAGFTNAGVYSVVVSNTAGSVSSPAAIVNVTARLNAELAGKLLRLTWPSGYVLQSAGNPAGPYIDVPAASSPFMYDPAAGPMKFFRLKSPPPRVDGTFPKGGPASISVSGAPGLNYVIQASTNLANWVNLATNTAPGVFIDTETANYASRFYRAVPALLGPQAPTIPAPVVLAQPAALTGGIQGGSTTLKAEFTSSTPLLYQWQRNGQDIPGATTSALALKTMGYADAGVYRLIAGNSSGTVISAPAVVNVAPRIGIKAEPAPVLEWDGSFILQAANSPAGPYVDVAPAPTGSSFAPVPDPEKPQQFFRLKSQPFSLTTTWVDSEAMLTVSGSPGCNFIIQVSPDSVHWNSVHTNTAPCVFKYVNSTGEPITFRVVPAS